MPDLNWSNKRRSKPNVVKHDLDSIVYPGGKGYPDSIPQNHIYLGDNLGLMSSLFEEYKEKIDLIYIDPPFFTNKTYRTRIGSGEDSRKPDTWELGEGYADRWDNLDDYLNMLYPRLVMMYDLLSPTGSLYLHLDWRTIHYLRVILDEIFGSGRLLNEIIWTYHGPSPIRSAFNRKHDTILLYTKSENYTFNVDDVREPYNPSTVKTFASSKKAGFGKIPNLERGKVPEDWWYFPVVARLHRERTGYPTQKPRALLERMIKASSNPGDLVADFFCGSGTTAVVSSNLDRRFMISDNSWSAVHTARKRLVENKSNPFALYVQDGFSFGYTQVNHSEMVDFNSNMVSINPVVKVELDYWEVDPNFNDTEFKSYSQRTRPRRKGEIPDTIELNDGLVGENIQVRMVDINGNAKITQI